jgi:hypothetical protein
MPPQNWSELKILAERRRRTGPLGRLRDLFRNDIQASRVLMRKWGGQRELSSLEAPLGLRDEFANEYGEISDDLSSFCKAKGIQYIQFIQPTRFYLGGRDRNGGPEDALAQPRDCYRRLEAATQSRTYGRSATGVFTTSDEFTDDCHLTRKGTDQLALTMAAVLAEEIRGGPRRGD